MIEESYVSFGTARMLKEAGFDVPCEHWYDEEGLRDCDYKAFQCPTQTLAARWLREVHNIDIIVDVYNKDYYYCNIYQNKHLMIIKNIVNANYDEVLEDGLREALNLIIKKKDYEQRND